MAMAPRGGAFDASLDDNGVRADATREPDGDGRKVLSLSRLLVMLGACWRRGRYGVVAFVMVVTILCGQPNVVYGMGNAQTGKNAPPAATVPQGKPNHANATLNTKSVLHTPPAPKGVPPFTPLKQQPPMAHGFVPSMKPGKLVLSPTAAMTFTGSDGKLEIDVPAAAITAADVTAAGGQVVLAVSEVAPDSGSNAGGSGIVSFGSYLVQVQDAHGNAFTHGLRVPATLKLHYGTLRGIDTSQAFVTFNGSHPKSVTNLGPYSTQKATDDPQHQVLQAQLPADPKAAAAATPTATPSATPTGTVTATPASTPTATPANMPSSAPTGTPTHSPTGTSTSTPSTSSSQPIGAKLVLGTTTAQMCQCLLPNTYFTWDTYAPIAKFGNPDPFNVDLNAGSLTEGTQIDVPPGPAGAMPNITLAYNSSAVNESHSPQGAAGWVGEGWSMTLGSISWAEHNALSNTCSGPGCTNGEWEDSWVLNDPFGTSTQLIPPNNGTATYYEDSPNFYCVASSTATPCPIQFQTARQTYAKVYAYVGPKPPVGTWNDNPPCFRVYLANGVMEEFGCTADSLQYYPIQANSQPGQTNNDLYYPINWMLDLITNPQGDQVHITYQADMQTALDGLTYPRDLVMKTIEWDSKGCVNAQTACSSWQPLYRVYFDATHQQSQIARTTTTGTCNSSTAERCDDPASVSGGVGAPLVNGTFALNDIDVQINTSSENGGTYNGSDWNTLRDYQLSYEQSGPGTITDPVTNKSEQTAGYFDLTQVQEVGDGNGNGMSAYPPTTYTYTSQAEYYEDGAYTPATSSLCGPSWNTGGNGGTCDLWSQSYDGNSRYLATATNGQGLQQSFSWANARNNTHGVNPGGPNGDQVNPLYCGTLSQSQQATYPCNSADDQAWSRIVLTGRSDSVTQLTQAGQGGQQTSQAVTSSYGYTYWLTSLTAKECLDCVAGMYWGNQNDGDYLDYYNATFMGFSAASVSNPDGAVVTHQYYTTQGWGIYSTSVGLTCPSTLPPINTNNPCNAAPWWNVQNAGHGLETGTLYYATDGVTLLKQVANSYQAVCPAGGASATPQYTSPQGTFGPWKNSSGVGQQVAELDHNNPVAVCDVQLTQTATKTWDGQTTNAVTDTESYTYDSSGRVTKVTSQSNGGGASPTTIVKDTGYQTINSLQTPAPVTLNNTPQTSGWGGSYILDLVNSTDTQDGSGTKTGCTAANYGTTNNGTTDNVGAQIESDQYASCGGTANKTTMGYDNLGNQVTTEDADAWAGVGGHTGASGTACAGATSCTSFGDSTKAVTTGTANAANQQTSTTQTYNVADGFGQWPASTKDANGVTTAYTYDGLGRTTSVSVAGQSNPATQQTAYYVLCVGQNGAPPCFSEVDTAQRLSSGTSELTRQFYDGQGRLVETRKAAPGGQDSVQYTLYNVMGQASQQSVSYFVAAYTGPGGVAAAFSIPDTNQSVTTTTYDGLGRTLSVTDPLSEVSSMSYSVVCNAPGTNGDAGCYEQTLALDANDHQTGTLADGFGRQIYAQQYSGNVGPYTLYATTVTQYDTSGRTVVQTHADGTSKTTYTYNADGTLAKTTDPDQGTTQSCYDANGNAIQTMDARSQSMTCGGTPSGGGVTYTGYDGLNRPVWRNTGNTASGAYVTYSYDNGMAGSYGTGRLTAETFRQSGSGTNANTFSGAYTYTYDQFGRTTQVDQTMGGAGACPTGWTCQDIGYTTPAGGQNAAGDGIWTIQASGSDVWGTSDGLHLVSESLSGDGSIAAHFDSQTVTGTYTKMGVMLRSSNLANSPEYNLQVDANGLYYVTYRATAGGSTTNQASGTMVAPVWLQVSRSGSTYSAYSSVDGVNWTYVPNSRVTLSLGASVLAGVFATAYNTSAVSIATVDSVSVTTGGTGACPTGWTCQDIGSPALAGTQNYLGNGEWTVVGSGNDIYGTSDQFHYVDQSISGDGTLVGRMQAQTNTGTYAKMGVMFRASSVNNAAFFYLQWAQNGQWQVVDRTATGGSASEPAAGTVALPVWLKVARTGGTTFTASTSPDGQHWTQVYQATLSALSGTILEGVAVNAYNTGALNTATIDNVSPSFTAPGSVTVTPMPTAAGVTSYPIQQSYDDAGAPLTTTYPATPNEPDGETVTTSYTAQDWLAGLSTTQSGTTTNLLSNVSYSGSGGAAEEMTGASLANGVYSETLSYDAMARPTETSLTRVSDSALLFDSKRAYDPVGNVANVWTTLPTGTDYQAFCYDEQNRLWWASSQSGGVPCGGSWTAGSLGGSAQYTDTYVYDPSNRLTATQLTSGLGGSYTYGDSNHEDAVTAIGSSYTASYDSAGNMTCRAPTSSTTCSGTPTGAQLAYDNEGRLAAWQNAPSNPTSNTSDLYDGEGNRVEQFIANGSTTTAITYISNVEEVSTTAGITSTTTSYYAAGQRVAQAVNGVFSYLGSDGLGSAEVALDGSGNAQASVLYDPYGNGRYSSGTMPGSYGYTGQRADSATGLDYYNARFYDPVAGQFASADSVQDGLNRYAYVKGNPETWTDPSGHIPTCGEDCGGPTCTSNCGTGTGGKPPDPTQPTQGTGGASGTGSALKMPPFGPLLCGSITSLCDWIRSTLSSLPANELGDWLRKIGAGLIGAGVLVLVLDVIYTLKFGSNKVKAVEFALDLMNTATIAISALSSWPGISVSLVHLMNGLVFGLITALQGVAFLLNQFGWFGQASVSAAIEVGTNAADAEVAPIEDGLGAILGGSISFLLGGIGNLLITAGETFIAWGYSEQGN